MKTFTIRAREIEVRHPSPTYPREFVSIKGSTYQRIRAYAKAKRLNANHLTEQLIVKYLDTQERTS